MAIVATQLHLYIRTLQHPAMENSSSSLCVFLPVFLSLALFSTKGI